MAINNVTIEGNLTRDPAQRYTTDGKPVVSFSIAQNTKNADGTERAHYFDCVKFCTTEKQADYFMSLCKGHHVVVSGRLTYDRREKDGRVYVNISVRVHEVVRCTYADAAQKTQEAKAPAPSVPDADVYDDEIPF